MALDQQVIFQGYLHNLGVAQNLVSVSWHLQYETEDSKEIPGLPETRVCQSAKCPSPNGFTGLALEAVNLCQYRVKPNVFGADLGFGSGLMQ